MAIKNITNCHVTLAAGGGTWWTGFTDVKWHELYDVKSKEIFGYVKCIDSPGSTSQLDADRFVESWNDLEPMRRERDLLLAALSELIEVVEDCDTFPRHHLDVAYKALKSCIVGMSTND